MNVPRCSRRGKGALAIAPKLLLSGTTGCGADTGCFARLNWTTTATRRPIEKLWNIVINAHLRNCKEKNIDSSKTTALVDFSQCIMMFYESPADFKIQFEF